MSDLLNSSSLVMVPSGYKEDTVYSVVPSDGSGDLSFTRASNGTRINSAGLVEDCPWNLLEYSNAFNTAPWSMNVTSGQAGKDGQNNAWLLTKAGASTSDFYNSNVYNGDQTFTIYVKKESGKGFKLFPIGTTTQFTEVNLQTGAVYFSTSGITSTTVEAYSSTWWKISVALNMVNSNYYIYVTDGAGTQIAGSITIQDAQVNVGLTAKPYFPTTDRLNVPRLTYQNGGGGCPSLLLEKQSTNLIAYSNGNSADAFRGTLTNNVTTSPEGVSNAFSFLVNSGQSGGIGFITITTSAQSYTFSAYLKGSVNGQKVELRGDLNGIIETFTLTTDWVRYTKTFTGSVGAQTIYLLNGGYLSPADYNLYYAYGMQLEASSYATSLIPTSGSSATRVADAFALKDITSFSIGNAYTILLDVTMQSSDNNKLFFETRTSTNATSLTARNFNGALRLFNNIDASYPLAAVSSSTNKWVVRINGTSYDLFAVSGGIATKDSATITTARNFGYFELAGSTTQLYFDELVIFPTALTDAECQSLVL